MTVTAVYDANVLYPSLLRDLLIRVATKAAVQARWSELILDEVFRNLILNRPDLRPESLTRTRTLMNDAIRDVTITGHEYLTGGLELPDPDDRHVLAAAIHAQAEVIVTFNLKDFPTDALDPFGVAFAAPGRSNSIRHEEVTKWTNTPM